MLTISGGRLQNESNDIDSFFNIMIDLSERAEWCRSDVIAEDDPLFLEHATSMLQSIGKEVLASGCILYVDVAMARQENGSWPVICEDLQTWLSVVRMLEKDGDGEQHRLIYPIRVWTINPANRNRAEKAIRVSQSIRTDEFLARQALEQTEGLFEVFPSFVDALGTADKRETAIYWIRNAATSSSIEIEWRANDYE